MGLLPKNILVVILCIGFCCGYGKIIELNHDLGPHSPFFPTGVKTTFKLTSHEAGYSRGYWLAYGEFTTLEHLSTFVAAPYTLNPLGKRIDEIPFKDLFSTAAVIDVRDKVAKNNSYEVSVQDVDDWIKQNGMFPKHCIVIFNTGWDEGRYPHQIAYFGSNTDLILKYPGVSLEALNYILSHESSHGIHFVGFGTDTPSLNPRIDIVDAVVSNLNKYLIRSLKDLKRLPSKGAEIITMPMKIKNGAGSPTRVAARLPEA